MTIREKMEEMLVDHMLWPDEAKAVVAAAEKDEVLDAMQGRWGQDTEGYPPQVVVATWISVKHVAVEWLKANKPQHFALMALDA